MPLIGVISDTHGLLRPEALEALQGVDRIIHAGDVGDPTILEDLRKIAPVDAVRGNVDRGDWAVSLPNSVVVELEGRSIYVLHDRDALDLDPSAAGFQAVIFGHSHRPMTETNNGVLYLNPGSAGPKRFHLPICLAHLKWVPEDLEAEIIHLPDI